MSNDSKSEQQPDNTAVFSHIEDTQFDSDLNLTSKFRIRRTVPNNTANRCMIQPSTPNEPPIRPIKVPVIVKHSAPEEGMTRFIPSKQDIQNLESSD
jgi:hypothetical protein